MSLSEALVVVALAAVGVETIGGLSAAALRARAGVECDVVGGYVLDGFLEEAQARGGRAVPPIPPVHVGRLRWVRRWLGRGPRGPVIERLVEPGRVVVRVRFDGASRELSGAVVRGAGT